MPLWNDTVCSACGRTRDFTSDSLALQLDDGSLRVLPHPAERSYCEKYGLTLHQASQRKRLFEQEYFVCRRCGRQSITITRARRGPAIDEAAPWAQVKIAVVITAVGVPIGLIAHWWKFVGILATLVLLSPLIDLNERRKARRRRLREGKPLLPTADAPGRVEVPEPRSTGPCCSAPDPVPAGQLDRHGPVPCETCGKGTLHVVASGVA